jgi:hypothetical protein
MNNIKINHELQQISLKNKFLITFKYFLCNTYKTDFHLFYRALDLLKQKYNNENDIVFIDKIIRNNISQMDNIQNIISKISGFIYNYNNCILLQELINICDSGINYKLEHTHEILQSLIIENTNISLEQNNCLQRIEENINN